jgi:hypothetical protein
LLPSASAEFFCLRRQRALRRSILPRGLPLWDICISRQRLAGAPSASPICISRSIFSRHTHPTRKHLMDSIRSSVVAIASRPSLIVFPARFAPARRPLCLLSSARPQSAPPRARFCCQIRCSPSFLRCAVWSLLCFVTLPWPGPAVLAPLACSASGLRSHHGAEIDKFLVPVFLSVGLCLIRPGFSSWSSAPLLSRSCLLVSVSTKIGLPWCHFTAVRIALA